MGTIIFLLIIGGVIYYFVKKRSSSATVDATKSTLPPSISFSTLTEEELQSRQTQFENMLQSGGKEMSDSYNKLVFYFIPKKNGDFPGGWLGGTTSDRTKLLRKTDESVMKLVS